MPRPSHFIWYELITSDIDAAARFYGEGVQWTANSSGQPGQDYRQWSIGGETVGGLMAAPPEAKDMPPVWMGYVNVDNVDESIAKVRSLRIERSICSSIVRMLNTGTSGSR